MSTASITESEAEARLLAAFEEVAGRPPEAAERMICRMSARRATTESWKWVRRANPSFPISLVWG